jgi:hypothetical protein
VRLPQTATPATPTAGPGGGNHHAVSEASEEYPEFVGSSFNDVYGVNLNGVQVAVDNEGNPITINGPFFSGGSVVVEPARQTPAKPTPIRTVSATCATIARRC